MIYILLSMQPWSGQGGGDPEGLVNGEKNVLDVVKYVEITFDESRPQKEIAHDNNIGSYQRLRTQHSTFHVQDVSHQTLLHQVQYDHQQQVYLQLRLPFPTL